MQSINLSPALIIQTSKHHSGLNTYQLLQKRPFFFIIIFLLPIFSVAQTGRLNGTVLDASTKEPLAFVSLTLKGASTGTVTDIDGRFSFGHLPDSPTLVISHVGYKPREVTITNDITAPLAILIEPVEKELETVTILPGENPAFRIIRLAQQNKKQNDPESYSSFKYNAYTVAALGAGNMFWKMNSIENARREARVEKKDVRKNTDSAAEKLSAVLNSRFRENYFLVTESYTERIFRYPRQSKETVLATKISGFQSASFAFTTSNFQPFGFYKDYIQMLDKPYTNPLINGSIGLYKFKLTAVRPHENDTTFIISFEPRKNTNFTGLKGLLYINSAKYAIENVIASPAEEKGLIMRFRLQQKYERNNGNWFPAQLNSTILQADIKTDSVLVFWDTRSYIDKVNIGQQFSNKDFSDLSLDYLPGSGKRSETEWTNLRKDSLKQKEKNTYETFKLFPPKSLEAFNKLNIFLEALALEAIPYGKLDIPFKYFITGINRYEKFRLGTGFQTNPLFSKLFSAGAFGGYGFGDKAWKYGANVQLNINERTVTKLSVFYSHDIAEPGNVAFFIQNSSVLSNQTLRAFYTTRMDSVEQYKINLTTKLRPFFQTDYWLLNEQRSPAGYPYEFKNVNTNVAYRQFRNTEAGFGMRLTSGESFTKMGRAKIIAHPAATEILLQVSQGLNKFLNGSLQYTKVALQLNHTFTFKRLGQTLIQLQAGQVWGDVPYAYLFNTHASRTSGAVTLYVPNTFQTAGLYEFAADKSIALFLQHNFGNLLYRPKSIYFRPELLLVQNISFGSLDHRNYHEQIDFKSPDKGLYESGLLIKNLYRKDLQFVYLGIGGGIFYRYGYYSLPRDADNWVFKFGVNISF